MNKRLAILVICTLIIGILGIAFKFPQVNAGGTIYIRADASIDPSTAPITRNGSIYTMNDNITGGSIGILIERSDMIFDGAGYVLQGNGGGAGFALDSVNNVTVTNTNIQGFRDGIGLYFSSNNIVIRNNITANTRSGVCLLNSSNNQVRENRIMANNGNGVWLDYSSSNAIAENSIKNNINGIWLSYSSSDNVVSGNDISANQYDGIGLGSSYNTLCGNNITNNRGGIWFSSAPRNKIFGNNIIGNIVYGVSIDSESAGNVWDDGYSCGGNYWSGYSLKDFFSGPYQNETGSDGIGDSPIILGNNNTDNYPLMGMFSSFATISGKFVRIVSNSSIDEFAFYDSNGTIRILVSNKTANQTHGFCRLLIPHGLMSPPYTVVVNGTQVACNTVFENKTVSVIYVNYTHSTIEVTITAEFPPLIILLIFIVATMMAVMVNRRRHSARLAFSH